ncbi:hypothetical protein BDZ45DRAFT_692994 [Acephala macrosclerotiorum]|nr:hypothetical protein BDZ45DRAFT_692994 [Acephala macrosclerotiorum]
MEEDSDPKHNTEDREEPSGKLVVDSSFGNQSNVKLWAAHRKRPGVENIETEKKPPRGENVLQQHSKGQGAAPRNLINGLLATTFFFFFFGSLKLKMTSRKSALLISSEASAHGKKFEAIPNNATPRRSKKAE